MEGLKMIPYLALAICISGVILGASSITLGEFAETLDDKCWNASYSYLSSIDACNDTGRSVNETQTAAETDRNFSYEYWVIWSAQDGEATVGEQLGTVAIIGIMVVVISLIAGVFVYMRYFG